MRKYKKRDPADLGKKLSTKRVNLAADTLFRLYIKKNKKHRWCVRYRVVEKMMVPCNERELISKIIIYNVHVL